MSKLRNTELVIPKPRGFFPYAYREEIRERGRCLAAFLAFINDNDLRPDRYWAKLSPFLFNEALKDIKMKAPEQHRLLMGSLDERRRKRLRRELQLLFGYLVGLLERGGDSGVRRATLGFSVKELQDGTEIIHAVATTDIRLSTKTVGRWLRFESAALLWWAVSWLRADGLKGCLQCGGFFLRSTAHEVKFCSDRCRLRAFSPKRKRKARKGKKGR